MYPFIEWRIAGMIGRIMKDQSPSLEAAENAVHGFWYVPELGGVDLSDSYRGAWKQYQADRTAFNVLHSTLAFVQSM